MLATLTKLFRGRRVLLEAASQGAAEATVRPLIEAIRAGADEVRPESSDVSLDCVVLREGLPACLESLTGVFGAPVKDFGEKVAFEPALRAMVDSRGGIQRDQCLFARRYQDGRVAYAALWPWSDPARITVKVGVYDLGWPFD